MRAFCGTGPSTARLYNIYTFASLCSRLFSLHFAACFSFSLNRSSGSDTMTEANHWFSPPSLTALCIDHLKRKLVLGTIIYIFSFSSNFFFFFALFINWSLWDFNLEFWNCFRGWCCCFHSSWYLRTSFAFNRGFNLEFTSYRIVQFSTSIVSSILILFFKVINLSLINYCMHELLCGS